MEVRSLNSILLAPENARLKEKFNQFGEKLKAQNKMPAPQCPIYVLFRRMLISCCVYMEFLLLKSRRLREFAP